MSGDAGIERAGRLSPERIRHTEFSRTTLGRRGYNVEEVDRFLGRLAEDLAARDAREARLRTEIETVKNALKDWQSSNSRAPRARPAPEAINLLSQAQQQADSYIAQAQDYCRQLVGQARGQADAVLTQAQVAAAQVVESSELTEKLDRTRAFLEAIGAVEAQLKAARERLADEVERLGG
ncbi:hypothetical protein Afil01_21560 [Actinorhabdospora filicis]|uniref:Cell wall synthesis protein Wag31 n=1 Tax=Actinorhabdospora filicis TaxID=1785913 RepID=A0A9W6SKI9_9ACTN|nr:DivIVA domain-containing protein [Actinorhabdospora filicis]GLZ77349.1 hypothetical protein Afil01_21560 [Actinorhabdospora filicis]